MQALDIGCGRNKLPGSVGLDIAPLEGVDVVHDLNVFPYPFQANTFEFIRLLHVIEHVQSIVKTMEEIHRVAKPGCIVQIVTPHYSDSSSWQDPTHVWHLNTGSFQFFEEGFRSDYYSNARFRVRSAYVKLAKLYAHLGIEWLVNLRHPRYRFVRKFWEQHLCYIVRGKVMEFELEAVKPSEPRQFGHGDAASP